MSDVSNQDADAPHTQDDDVTSPNTDARQVGQPVDDVRQEELLDESLEETFPASDAPTPKHIT